MRNQADLLALYAKLEQEPFAYDYFQLMRRLECLYADLPRWGCAQRPAEEPIRLGQAPSLAFAPSGIARFYFDRDGSRPRLEVSFFGMLGPNGPLPLHLSDYARQRVLHYGDRSFVRFLDIIHHRFLALFYRAWAQAQPTVSLDRPEGDRFSTYVASILGLGQKSLRNRDNVADHAKLFQAGPLARQIRNAEGLKDVLADYFGLPMEVEQYIGHWMPIEVSDQSSLGGSQLGCNAVLGCQVWDRQSKFRLRIGPLTACQYADFLPTGSALPKLVDWVRFYAGGELYWDVLLILRREEVPQVCLGQAGQLGWTSWLGKRRVVDDADDLVLDAERVQQGA